MKLHLRLPRAVLGALAVVVLFTLAAALGVLDGPWSSCILVRGLNMSECASWVQAWGSVGAIAAAGIGVWYQVVRNERMRSEEQLAASASYSKACYLVARDAAATLGYIARRLRESVDGRLRLRSDRVEDLQSTCRTLLAKDLAPKVLDRMLRVQTELAYSLMALKQLEQYSAVSARRADNAEKRAESLAIIARDLASYDMLYGWLGDQQIRRPSASDEDHSDMEIEEVK